MFGIKLNEALSRKKLKQSSPYLYMKADGSSVDKKSSESAINSYFTTLPSVPIPPQSGISKVVFPWLESLFSFPHAVLLGFLVLFLNFQAVVQLIVLV